MKDYPIQSLAENDLYKFSMAQMILHNFPETTVRVEFKCRGDEKLGYLKPKIDECLDHLCTLRFEEADLEFLGKFPWFKKDFLNYLRRLYLFRDQVHTEVDANGKLEMWAEGPWSDVIWFEIPCLAIVSQLYMEDKTNGEEEMLFRVGKGSVDRMIQKLNDYWNSEYRFTFADFGLRRRFSRDFQDMVVKEFKEKNNGWFVGTSNLYLARKYGLKPIGTFAHEAFMGIQGVDSIPICKVQEVMLQTWQKEFNGDLGIALSDIFGFKAFLRDFEKDGLYKLFDGCRHDSGDPMKWGEMLIKFYKEHRVDPRTKTGCWSDSLTVDRCVEILERFKDRIKISFGVGTAITNCTGIKPLNMVMKVVESNGKPAVKLSDSLGKSMCHDQEFVEYVKKQYNYSSIDE